MLDVTNKDAVKTAIESCIKEDARAMSDELVAGKYKIVGIDDPQDWTNENSSGKWLPVNLKGNNRDCVVSIKTLCNAKGFIFGTRDIRARAMMLIEKGIGKEIELEKVESVTRTRRRDTEYGKAGETFETKVHTFKQKDWTK